jgi:hypothetical protein
MAFKIEQNNPSDETRAIYYQTMIVCDLDASFHLYFETSNAEIQLFMLSYIVYD